jgi:hypothetical protein
LKNDINDKYNKVKDQAEKLTTKIRKVKHDLVGDISIVKLGGVTVLAGVAIGIIWKYRKELMELVNKLINIIKDNAHDNFIKKNSSFYEADHFVAFCYIKATLDYLISKGYEIKYTEETRNLDLDSLDDYN